MGLGIVVEMGDPPRVEGRASSNDAMHLVALLQQQLGQVGAVLPRNTRDQRHFSPLRRRRCCRRLAETIAARGHPGDSAMEDIFHCVDVCCV